MDIRTETQQCLSKVKELWFSAKEELPETLKVISQEKKISNESKVKEMMEEMNEQLNQLPHLPLGRKRWRRKTCKMIKNFLYTETIIGIHQSMSKEELDVFYEELEEFLRKVRQFSPELSFPDIGQAVRNYIVYAMFKVIHRVEGGFNLAAFGYSMLYPVTDNYIDSGSFTPEEKQAYNQFIRDTIQGKEVQSVSEHHRKTFDLLKSIEAEYPRENDTSVYTLLLMMLEAQEESLLQQQQEPLLTAGERLDISLFKGGVSVLVDRFLVNKPLTESDLIFYLGFGFFLQLADDLQDIGEDRQNGYQTLFTLKTDHFSEERLVNKLMHFLDRIMGTYSAENDRFKNFVMNSSYQLIYTSLMGSKEYFSEEYRAKLEQYLLVTPSFLEANPLKQIELQDVKNQEKYRKLLDAMIKKQTLMLNICSI